MKKLFFLFLLTALAFGSFARASAEENVTIYGVYLTDASGYDYGAEFFVDSDVNAEIYVSPYIISQENVNGALISGILLMQPNEKHVRVGSFISRDQSKAWSVNVGAKWKRADAAP
ncbi:hypothetical protein [Azotosporobacter soli]|uniref:hypothetical protein n=1 Tax=Azotosporobacter soli TaxID=3055040 RepID=UPI0031FED359